MLVQAHEYEKGGFIWQSKHFCTRNDLFHALVDLATTLRKPVELALYWHDDMQIDSHYFYPEDCHVEEAA